MATHSVVSQDKTPSFVPPNTIDLVSIDNSKILAVSLYSGRAEIQRLYKLTVKAGHNQVNINGLPNVMERDSIRMEGRGSATIHEVTVSDMPKPPATITTDIVDNLSNQKDLAERTLERAKKKKSSYGAYLSTLHVEHIEVETVDKVLEHYDSRVEMLDTKILALEKKIRELTKSIKDERAKLSDMDHHRYLGVRATITMFAESEGEVSIVLIYAVTNASWDAAYDIRVDMQTKEKRVMLTYKARISQDTGESWTDVPLTLETASPTFGVEIPTLLPWKLNVYRPPEQKKSSKPTRMQLYRASYPGKAQNQDGRLRSGRSHEDIYTPASFHASSNVLELESEEMDHRNLDITSIQGGITATFQVPGSITIPSDGVAHNVIVTQLELAAEMSWVTVPKAYAKVHLKARIQNASDYTLLPGDASVYVDGSFISKSEIPLVSPLESFDCPLGLDSSIRITYHPLSIKVTESGFYTKSAVHILNQRITIVNTKSIAIENLKVLDQLPISESSQIVVKPLTPALVLPETGGSDIRAPEPLKITDDVTAQWEGAEDTGSDVGALGKDGMFYFMCVVPPQGKLNLLVAWEVTAPISTRVEGF